jgi:hypothetical protein
VGKGKIFYTASGPKGYFYQAHGQGTRCQQRTGSFQKLTPIKFFHGILLEKFVGLVIITVGQTEDW